MSSQTPEKAVEKELKPCPFCGGKAGFDGDIVSCLNCQCEVYALDAFENKMTAIQVWNNRKQKKG